MQTLKRQNDATIAPDASAKSQKVANWFRAFFAALLLFAMINVALNMKTAPKRNTLEVLAQAKQEQQAGIPSRHTWAWWLSKYYQEQTTAPDVVVFGSSLLGSAHSSMDAQFLQKLIDVLAHRRMAFLEDQLSKRVGHKNTIFSLGSPGEMVSDFYVISKTLFTADKKPKLVIATIAPRDFIDSTLACPAATDHYKFFSSYLDLSAESKYACPDFFSRFGAEIDRLPLKQFGKSALFHSAEAPKTEWNQCESSRIEPGKSVVPASAVPKQVNNTAEYQERFRNPKGPNYASEMEFFKLFLANMKKQGIAVSIVCMPTTSGNRQLLSAAFWQKFRSDVSAACKSYDADWFDLSDSGLFVQSDYLDTVHLNSYGAVRLFPVIAERVAMIPSSRNAVDSNQQTPVVSHVTHETR